jgi:hypothetical protein
MALNFNLMNTDLPGQIAGSFQQGYQGAQDRTNVLEQREQQKRTQLAQLIQNGAKSIAASPSAYKSIFARVKKVAGVPLDDDEKRYDEAFATSGEEGVKKLAMADADFDMQTVLSLRDREAFEAYLKGQQPTAKPTNALTAARVAPGALGSGTFDPMAPAGTPVAQTAVAPTGLDLPLQAGSGIHRATGALDPSVIQRIGLPPQVGSGVQPVNALAPTAQTPVTQAPTNALAPTPVNSAEAIEAQIAQLSRFNDPRAAIEIKRLERQLTAMEPTADVKTMRALNIPLTPAGYEQYRQAQRQEQLTFQQRKELAREGRSTTPRAEPAPTIAQIEDPNNPGRMITIDARRYVPGTNVGVIGSAGKTTAAATQDQKSEAGKSQLQSELDNLRVAYENLETARAIPSTQRGGVSNILSGIAATGIGQATGRLVGTESQVERDVINSSKLRLMNAIKQATGMSAQQLNSNVELQTMLKSLSDPSQAIQTVNRIISSIENAYVKGQGMQEPSAAPKSSGNVVVTPDGQSHSFPTPAAAAQFKKAAGL